MLVLLGGALMCASPAAAQTSQACASAKQKALGKTASSVFGCYSKAAKLGAPVDPLCVQKAEDKWSFPAKGAFQKAEIKGGCALEGQNFVLDGRCSGNGTTVCQVVLDCPSLGTCSIRNDDTEAQALYDLVVDENTTVEAPNPVGLIDIVIPALIPNATANGCQSAKAKATGKYASGLLNCHSKAAKGNLPVDPACIAKATTTHTNAFNKAELKPPCDTTDDEGTVQAAVATFVERAVAGIARNDGCGSGVVLSPETCDDGNNFNTDNCPSDCIIDSCTPNSGSDDQWKVSFSSTKAVAAITAFVDYPEAKISILGSGGSIPAGEIDGIIGDPFTVASFNDHDHALTGVLAEGTGGDFGLTGDLFTVHFETCASAGAATAGEFTCTVVGAADAAGKALKGVTCTVSDATP
jgi:hypothetical protein